MAFAQFVLAQGRELTVATLKDAKDGKEQFENADEATKIQVLRSWLSPKLASEEEAALFIKYLQLVSEDGQYAIVQTVGEDFVDLLQVMYEQAIKHPQGSVAQLYQYFAEVATSGDNR